MIGSSTHRTLLFLLMLSGIHALSQKDWIARPLRKASYSKTFAATNPFRVKRQANYGRGNDVQLFQVETKILLRFASTTIRSRIYNRGSSPQPLDFVLQLPLSAYIANFTLDVNGVTYIGSPRDKCEGEDENTFDASGGLSSGRITALDPDRNTFMVSVSVAPGDTVDVMVNYQELLERIQGWYTQKISINPQQVVRDLRIMAYISEPQGISKVESGIVQLDGGSSSSSSSGGGLYGLTSSYTSLEDYIRKQGDTRVRMEFFPNEREQQRIGDRLSGINGDLILRYDIEHDYDVGHVQKFGDVFVHHFSPGGLEPIRKTVAFVIDVSGSMFGKKLNQTKQALLTIMDQMRSNDHFNIITFSDEVYHWREDEMVEASLRNIHLAKNHILSLKDLAGTNLNDAMIDGLNQLRLAGAMEPISAENPGICILFVLTDGDPTKGVIDHRTIERNVQNSNRGRCSVVTLGFGAGDVDFNFLARLALANNGVARKIFRNYPVADQLIGVYDEVATPLLANIAIEYLGDSVDQDSLTKRTFQNYFEGSEFAISGRLANLLAANLPIRITAISADGKVDIVEHVPITETTTYSNSRFSPEESTERTAAFITLAQLFNEYTVSNDPQEQKVIVNRAVQLSRQFNLLTPLMSMTISPQSGSRRGGAGSVPPTLQWGISGAAYEQPSTQTYGNTYGIGGRICTYEPVQEIDLHRLHIESRITDRYAQTNLVGELINRGEVHQDIPFTFLIPPGAFISDFKVEIDGRTYTGKVGDIRDSEWQQIFPSNGQQIALVTKRDPTKDTFTMRVADVAPQSSVNFDLTYDELLERRSGVFEHRVNLWPGQVVDDLQVDMYITEPQGLGDVALRYYPRTSDGTQRDFQVRRSSDYRAHMRYAPSANEQLAYTSDGLAGDMVLTYDVRHSADGSYTEVDDDHFVHFFSPSNFEHADKQVVFVIDISSSMAGTKLRQVKEALKIILDDLGPNDRFNILVFSDDVQYWRRNALVTASRRNIEAAKTFVDGLIDQGETNLGDAVLQADALLDLQSRFTSDNNQILSMMYVLSDGQPTIGITDHRELIQAITQAINGEHALFALGFGRNVSFDLLIQLALQNQGSARRIYETADASKQLQNAYFDVSRPVIFDVDFEYEPGVSNPEDLTRWTFPFYFEGSEVSVAGKVVDRPTSNMLQGSVTGQTATGQAYQGNSRQDIRITRPELNSDHTVTDVVQRIWAIKTFQDLINQYAITEDATIRQTLADRIAELAISYNFVTPLTPLSLTSRGQSRIDVQPPSIIHTGTTMDILRSLLEEIPVQPPVVVHDDPLNVATQSSDGIEIKSLNMDSDIVLRFATTTISSTLENTGSQAGWAVFRQKIPLPAYITNFTLTVDGKTYYGVADEKSQNITLHRGNLEISQGGAFITELDAESKVFLVSVKLEPGASADFELTYQMLLPRRRGMYYHPIPIFPGQVVNNLGVDVSIIEPQGVNWCNAYLTDRSLVDSTARLPQPTTRPNQHICKVSYRPSRRQQQHLSTDGVMGNFIVEYDVNHANDAGDIQVLNDYFVQFFSPSHLPVLRKHVVFVIDISSSMAGTKLSQVKAALRTILDDIAPGDKFNILPFSNQVLFLDRYKMVEATPPIIQYTKEYVDKLQVSDATNLNDAILEGVKMLRRESEKVRGAKVISMLVVLTDGEPTYGEIDKREIQRNVQDAIKGDYSLFCLAFGEDADFEFLNRLALNNHGVARRIPERADASLLLEGFYEEVATPLLYDVQFYYSNGVVPNTLSERFFPNYFNGSEIVVVGKLDENRLSNHVLRSIIYGKTSNSSEVSLALDTSTAVPSRILLDPSIPDDIVERIWAYLMIQSLERERDASENPNPVIQREITDTSLHYSYLNPYTRMTVSEQHIGSSQGSSHVTHQGDVGLNVWEQELPTDVRDGIAQALSVISYESTSTGGDGGGGGSPSTGSGGGGNSKLKVQLSLCFDIGGDSGDVINLVKDRSKGMYVNAKIITEPSQQNGVQGQKTYIDEIGAVFSTRQRGNTMRIRFTPSTITINTDYRLQWDVNTRLQVGNVGVNVDGHMATITLPKGIEFTVSRYQASRNQPRSLGFHLNKGSGLSQDVQGIVGQFQRGETRFSMNSNRPGRGGSQTCGIQIDTRGHPLSDDVGHGNCWVSANVDVDEGFVEGSYADYLMSDVFAVL